MGTMRKLAVISLFFLIISLSACTDAEVKQMTPDPYSTSQISSGFNVPVMSNAAWTPHIEEIDGVLMALVPPGCFMMGITGDQIEYLLSYPSSNMQPEDFKDQMPAHEVCFEAPFWIDLTEVPQEQFSRLNGEADLQSHFQGKTLPREQIAWMEAAEFCEKRGARLPTEAEWEFAARGPDGNLFHWGNGFDCRMGNFDDTEVDDPGLIDGSPNCDGYATTAPVGSVRGGESWVGAKDLAGNVWEWVWDRYGHRYYTSQAGRSINPNGPTSGEYRVVRGGAWSINEVDHLSATFRGGIDPGIANEHLGFRCARSSD